MLGACWHFLGQGAFIRLVAASGRLVRLNVLEANALLLGLSHLGNRVAGSRMRRVVGEAAEVRCGFFLSCVCAPVSTLYLHCICTRSPPVLAR